MRKIHVSLLLFPSVCLIVAGCAQRRAPVQVTTCPAQRSSQLTINAQGFPDAPDDPKAALSLGQIKPQLAFPKAAPTSAPSSLPPVEAVRLFAQARIAVLDGKRTEAGRLLDQAIALDPGSFDLHKSLGDLYGAASDARAAGEWEKAAAIEPDHLDLQIALGRQAMDAGDSAQGLEHLRLALETAQYRRGDPAAGEADFLLASALQKEGYDRAAIEIYQRLLARLQHAHFAERANPQVAILLAHPDALALHVAALYEKNRAYAPALQLLRAIASSQPANVELQTRVVRDEAASGDRARAITDAAALVKRSHADPRSVALLSDAGGDDAVAALRRLRESNPVDRDLAYALSDLLRHRHRDADAAHVLADAMGRWPDDPRLLRRQAELLRDSGNMGSAARLLIAALARRPDHAIEIDPVWDQLSRPSPRGAWGLADLTSLHVASGDEPARLVLLARLAEQRHRDAVEREALSRAIDGKPAFAPAFREMLSLIQADPARSAEQRTHDSAALADRAALAGDGALAAELRGQALLDEGHPPQAATAFAAAVKAGDLSPELYMNFAAALHASGDERGAQSLLWKLVSDRPLAADAYEELYAIDQKLEEPQRARGVLAVWLAADPDAIGAHRLQALDAFKNRQFMEAERILNDLLDQHDTDPQVLAAVVQFYSETGRIAVLIPRVIDRVAAEPWNAPLAIALSDSYEREHQRADALRVLDGVRASAAAARDVDLLSTLAGEYGRLDAAAQSEAALSDVLRLDPSFAVANNDLAYTWAEQDKNLGEAEQMARKALTAEPDNLSFLDSMGWVLYKRGRFHEALCELQRAAALADPVVLDHLGDTLYRLGEQARAAAQWSQAAEKLGPAQDDGRDDLKKLRERLTRKQQQLAAGHTVEVAPVAEEK
jgi:predicted Zn-dependent protease